MVLYLLKKGKRNRVLPNTETQNEKKFCFTCGILIIFAKGRRFCVDPCGDIVCLKCILSDITDENYRNQVMNEIEEKINLEEEIVIDISIMDIDTDEDVSERDMPEFERQDDRGLFSLIIETPPPSPHGYLEQIDEVNVESSNDNDSAGLGWYFCIHCCSHGFKNKCCLGRHFREEHLDIRPYQCNICDWTFETQCNLVQHIQSHIKDPYFKCGHCQTAYGRKKKMGGRATQKRKSVVWDYDKSDKMSKMKYYSCVICSSQFHEKVNLDRHLNNAHGIRVKLTDNEISIVEEYCPDCQNLLGSEYYKKVSYTECGHISCLDCVIKADDLGCGQCTTEKAQEILMMK